MASDTSAKVFWARLSIASNSLLLVLKLAVGLLSGSISIVSEAIHSGMDLVAAMIAYLGIRTSVQPPDEKHPFGHGKFENLSGLIESALIFGAGVVIIYESVRKLQHPAEIGHLDWGIAVMLVSAVVNLLVSHVLIRVGRKTESIALQTDGHHLLVDVYTSAGVMLGLIAIKLTGVVWLDPVISIVVALYIVFLGIRLSIESSRDLLDEGLSGEEVAAIEAIIGDRAHEISSFHRLATRRAGGTRMIEVDVCVHGSTTVDRAHALATHIEHDIRDRFPGARVTTHIEPCERRCDICRLADCPDHRTPT